MNVYLYNRNTGKVFQVMAIKDGTITLKNELAEFSDTYDKEKFQRQGYMKVTGEDEAEARAAAEAKIAEEKQADDEPVDDTENAA